MKTRYWFLPVLLATVGGGAIKALATHSSVPAYVITEIEVTDGEAFREYAPRVQASFAPFGGRYLVRGGDMQSFAGEPPKRIVVLAFDSMERVQSWYTSPEYEALKGRRDKAGKARIFAVEGLAP